MTDETAEERFERLAKPRLKQAKKQIDLLQNLAKRPSYYSCTKAQAAEIVGEIEEAVAALRSQFKLPAAAQAEPSNVVPIRAEPEPTFASTRAENVGDLVSEASWALEALRRKNYGLAEARLEIGLAPHFPRKAEV